MANPVLTIEARATFITLMLREDHQKVRRLFEQFDNTTMTEKREIVEETLVVLEVHTKLRQELIYPAWREHVHEQGVGLMDEARETLHVVHALIDTLKNMNPENERYESMCKVLKEQVTHQIDEEEGKIFPLAVQTDLDWERLTTHVTAAPKLGAKTVMAVWVARDCQRARDSRRHACGSFRPIRRLTRGTGIAPWLGKEA